MVFSSLTFMFAYLALTIPLYFLVPLRWRNLVLLLVSLFFYGWGEPVYIITPDVSNNYLLELASYSARYTVHGTFASHRNTVYEMEFYFEVQLPE